MMFWCMVMHGWTAKCVIYVTKLKLLLSLAIEALNLTSPPFLPSSLALLYSYSSFRHRSRWLLQRVKFYTKDRGDVWLKWDCKFAAERWDTPWDRVEFAIAVVPLGLAAGLLGQCCVLNLLHQKRCLKKHRFCCHGGAQTKTWCLKIARVQ